MIIIIAIIMSVMPHKAQASEEMGQHQNHPDHQKPYSVYLAVVTPSRIKSHNFTM
jgi:hypothetical protein